MLFIVYVVTKDLKYFIPYLKENGYSVYGTCVTNGTDISTLKKNKKLAVVMGNEGQGISYDIKKELDKNDMITNYDAKYSALTIAKYVLRKCTLQNKPLTNIKLQKMLFMIQKEYLKYNNLCFYENIEAWQFGPCIPKVYYRNGYCYGVMPIRQERDYCADLLISLDDRLVISTVVDKYIDKDNLCWRFPLMEKLCEENPQRIVYFEDILKENDYDSRTEESNL